MTSPADYHHFPSGRWSMRPEDRMFCVSTGLGTGQGRARAVPPDMVNGRGLRVERPVWGQQALAISTVDRSAGRLFPVCPRAEATNQTQECGGRQRLAQVSSWRAEVAFSRPEADQAVCCQALVGMTGRALGKGKAASRRSSQALRWVVKDGAASQKGPVFPVIRRDCARERGSVGGRQWVTLSARASSQTTVCFGLDYAGPCSSGSGFWVKLAVRCCLGPAARHTPSWPIMAVLSRLRDGHRYSENKSESRHVGTGMGSSQSWCSRLSRAKL